MVRVFGIDVYLHWTWLIVAYFQITNRAEFYTSQVWNVIEYVSLFAIVLLHEFGHALACRQAGGIANRIMLWPLGGVAFVQPPPRPGALLWSIAAGPLVNVVLVPITVGMFVISVALGGEHAIPNLYHFCWTLAMVNGILLIFNMLPIYPLDGGQVLHALLWFVMDRATSLKIASITGLVGAAGVVLLAVVVRDPWLGVLAVFVGFLAFMGFQRARLMSAVLNAPRRGGLSCPNCGAAPPIGPYWACDRCHTRFDPFEVGDACPKCGK